MPDPVIGQRSWVVGVVHKTGEFLSIETVKPPVIGSGPYMVVVVVGQANDNVAADRVGIVGVVSVNLITTSPSVVFDKSEPVSANP